MKDVKHWRGLMSHSDVNSFRNSSLENKHEKFLGVIADRLFVCALVDEKCGIHDTVCTLARTMRCDCFRGIARP